jgi:cell division protease FtsH
MEQIYFPMPGDKEYSDKTAEEIDGEVKRFMDQAYDMAKELIQANRDKVETIANALLKYETLDAEDVKVILDGGQLDKPTVTDLLAAEQAKADNPDDAQAQTEKDAAE